MLRREFFVTGASATLVACAQGHSAAARAASPDAAERATTIAALRPPRRARPVVAIIGASAGAETTDLIIPFGVLRQSGVMDVQVVAAVGGHDRAAPDDQIEFRGGGGSGGTHGGPGNIVRSPRNTEVIPD